MSQTHTKKVLKKYFDEILSGQKTYEVRLADWHCNEGDTVELVEIDDEMRQPTGRTLQRKVGAVIRTKEIEKLDWWPQEDMRKYGFQVLALVSEKESSLPQLQHRAVEIRDKYAKQNAKDGRSKWAGKEFMMGFVGDVGDLTKLIMAKENLRHIDNLDAKLKHELGDCLWSLLVIADQYNIDLKDTFSGTMHELDQRLAA